MANHKKKYPRDKFIHVRVTMMEKLVIEEEAMRRNMDMSLFLRKMLGLGENE